MQKRMVRNKCFQVPYLGFGLGLRSPHYEELLVGVDAVEWLEIISENFMLDGGKFHRYLDRFSQRYPLIAHGVSLSVGNAEDFDDDYIKRLKSLTDALDCPWFSDHICWTGRHGSNMHNLLPLPYSKRIADFIAEKIQRLQQAIGRPFLLENVSSYVEYTNSEMTEWDFLAYLSEKADCGLLLDVNNVYVSSRNHQFDPMTFMKALPPERVIQYHIAGHTDKETHIVDTHDQDVCEDVWDLFEKTVPLFGDVSLIIERDDHIPPLSHLLKELDRAREIYQGVMKND